MSIPNEDEILVQSAPGFQDMIISVGDEVAYPGRQSSSLWMNTGEVVEIRQYELRYGRGLGYAFKIKRHASKSWEKEGKLVWVHTKNILRLPKD